MMTEHKTVSIADQIFEQLERDILAGEYVKFFANETNLTEFRNLIAELEIIPPEQVNSDSGIAGKSFVITGPVHIWKNRNELKAFIEVNGGKVVSAVSSKTNYLINNDKTSKSTKNKTAEVLGIPVISEEDFQELVQQD